MVSLLCLRKTVVACYARFVGEMAERSNVPSWKDGVLERVPRVRIPFSPHENNEPNAFAFGSLLF